MANGLWTRNPAEEELADTDGVEGHVTVALNAADLSDEDAGVEDAVNAHKVEGRRDEVDNE